MDVQFINHWKTKKIFDLIQITSSVIMFKDPTTGGFKGKRLTCVVLCNFGVIIRGKTIYKSK